MLDQAILAQSLALAIGFAFGVIQIFAKNIVAQLKIQAFIALSTISTLVLYFGLVSGNVVLQIIIAAISSAYAFTGSIDFYKNDVK